jgi:hypothetical protein
MHTEQVAKLLFCVLTFWKILRLIILLELNNNKYFQNFFSQFHYKLIFLVLLICGLHSSFNILKQDTTFQELALLQTSGENPVLVGQVEGANSNPLTGARPAPKMYCLVLEY